MSVGRCCQHVNMLTKTKEERSPAMPSHMVAESICAAKAAPQHLPSLTACIFTSIIIIIRPKSGLQQAGHHQRGPGFEGSFELLALFLMDQALHLYFSTGICCPTL